MGAAWEFSCRRKSVERAAEKRHQDVYLQIHQSASFPGADVEVDIQSVRQVPMGDIILISGILGQPEPKPGLVAVVHSRLLEIPTAIGVPGQPA